MGKVNISKDLMENAVLLSHGYRTVTQSSRTNLKSMAIGSRTTNLPASPPMLIFNRTGNENDSENESFGVNSTLRISN